MSTTILGNTVSLELSVYPYRVIATFIGTPQNVALDLWFGWSTLVLIILAGIIELAGSLVIGKTGKRILAISGIVLSISLIVFVIGLQNELTTTLLTLGFPAVSVFSSGSYNFLGANMDYSSYLTFGFWIMSISTLLTVIAALKHPMPG